MTIPKPFSGRVIFDHLPKTGGIAIRDWLADALGTNCVTTTNLMGQHRHLRKVYGDYSVIVAHLTFSGEGLDPRYCYFTCLREPIDRAISWLYFVINNHDEAQLGLLWQQAERFVKTEGTAGPELTKNINNPYVEHFSSVFYVGDPRRSSAAKLAAAMSAIEQYDVWGLYEDFSGFLEDVAALIGLPAPGQLARANVTRVRPTIMSISPRLRKRLEELNALDIELYRWLRERWHIKRNRQPIVALPDVCPWLPYNVSSYRTFSAPDFTLLSAALDGKGTISRGETLVFALEFSLSVAVLELNVGIQIFDEFGRMAFGTNTELLKQPLILIKPGTHCIRYCLIADLPEGKYAAGFAFIGKNEEGERELAWYDTLLAFSVTVPRSQAGIGYCSLPVEVNYQQISDTHGLGCGTEN